MNDLDLLVELFAKAGKPVVEKKNRTKPRSIDYQPIVMDLNWLNDYDEATATPQQKRLQAVVKNLGATSIRDLKGFIANMNSFLNQKPNVEDHVAVIAKIDILRALHNMLGSPNEQVKGFQFENFIAQVFGGKVETRTSGNISDVVFPSVRTSLKLVAPGSSVQGSIKNLRRELFGDERSMTPSRTDSVKYIVGEKDPSKRAIEFYQFDFTREMFESLKLGNTKEPQFKISRDELKKFNYEELGTLDLSRSVELTESFFKVLDAKFKNLFSKLQELNDAADRFKYDAETQKSKQSTSAQKGRVTRKAGDVRKASQKA